MSHKSGICLVGAPQACSLHHPTWSTFLDVGRQPCSLVRTILIFSQAPHLRVDHKMWWTCWDHKISRSWIWAPQPLLSFSGSLIWSVTTFCDPLLTPQKQEGKQTSGEMTGYKCLGSISNCFSKLQGSTSWLREATSSWRSGADSEPSPYHCSQCRSDFTSFHLRFQAFGWLIGWFEKYKMVWSKKKVCLYQQH